MAYLQFIRQNLRWLSGGFLLAWFSSFGQTFYIALSTGYIRDALNLTSGEYGGIYMIATLASAIVLLFLGQLVDHYSVATVVVISALMLAFACFLLSISSTVPMLLVALFTLRLFGQGMLSHIALTAMGRWYSENRGKAVSIASLGFNFGQAILPISFVAGVAIMGWQNSWQIAALLLVIVATPVIYLLMYVERLPGGTTQEAGHVTDPHIRQWTRSQMLRDPLFWLASIGVLAPPFIGTAIFFHQDYLLDLKGWSVDFFAWTFIWMTMVSIISGVITGIAVDKWSAVTILPGLVLPMCIGCFVLAGMGTPVAMVLYMTCLGVSAGIVSAIFGSLWPEIYGTRHLGSIRSLIMAMMVLASALGPGIIGWLIDFGVPFTHQLSIMGTYCALATIVLCSCSLKFKQRYFADKANLSFT